MVQMEINEALVNHITELESELLNQNTRSNYQQLVELLADDFFEIGASGKIYYKESAIKAMLSETFVKRTIFDFKLIQISEEILLATYRIQQEGTEENPPTNSLRSSIWKKYHSKWKIIFHQGTLIQK